MDGEERKEFVVGGSPPDLRAKTLRAVSDSGAALSAAAGRQLAAVIGSRFKRTFKNQEITMADPLLIVSGEHEIVLLIGALRGAAGAATIQPLTSSGMRQQRRGFSRIELTGCRRTR